MSYFDDFFDAPNFKIRFELKVTLLPVFFEIYLIWLCHLKEELTIRFYLEKFENGSIQYFLNYLEFIFWLFFEQIWIYSPIFKLDKQGSTVFHLLFIKFSLILKKVNHHLESKWRTIDKDHFVMSGQQMSTRKQFRKYATLNLLQSSKWNTDKLSIL